MARTITDSRQVTIRSYLDQIALASAYAGTADAKPANQSELDNLLASLNSQITPLLRMSAASTPTLVVSVGGGDLTDSETNRRRAIPHVGTAYVQFSSGTITFPASNGGNIVSSPGTNTVLVCGSGNYCAVLVYLDGNGQLNTIIGADSAVLATAITNLPPSPDETLPLGFVVVQNIAGVIQNIAQNSIAQFGTGAGGGSGGATSAEAALRDYNNFAQTKYLDPNIFKTQKATKVDGASTGSFDLVKNAFKFTSIGNTFVSTNLANAEFLAEGIDIADAHLYVHWLLSFIDTAATYEVSRDGGTNWQTIDMSRVGTASNAYRGFHTFTDEVTQQSLQTVAASGAGTALNATTAQELSSQLVLATTSAVRQIQLQLNYGGVGTGTFKVQLRNNNAGVPSTAVADLRAESDLVTISSASLGGTGNITVTVDLPDTVLVAGTYHVVLVTDAAYKAGTLDLSWRSGAGTDGAAYNGTTWTGSAATKAATVQGRAHDLRIRITAGTALTYLEGMGVYFPSDDGMVLPNGTKYVERFYFTGDENRTQFTLNWTPDPDLLDIFDPKRGQIYAIEPGVAKIAGQTVTFEPDTFDFPGEDIVLIFRQIKGSAIDNSDSNAVAISEQGSNLLDIGNQISELDYVSIPLMAVPNTNIFNRSYMPDLSQDLGSRLGINRIMTQQLYQKQDEFDNAGLSVFGVVNDKFNQMRFIGSWSNQVAIDGSVVVTTTVDDYIEITFYGTGLNMMVKSDGARDLRASVDGGSEGADFTPTASTVLTGRNTASNMLMNVVAGLSLGIHTVKIRHASGNIVASGFEILNEESSGNLKINPGTQYVKGLAKVLATQQTSDYNSDFETGVLSTRGGRVLVYQKSDGTIAKAVQPAGSSQLNLTSANHADEEIARTYHYREFGANRVDDFSTLTTAGTSRAFTLDDDTTTLVGLGVRNISGTEAFNLNLNPSFIVFTFVGTGLDIIDGANGATAIHSVTIDGTSLGGTLSYAGSTIFSKRKLVSGLPYGTHICKIAYSSGGLGSDYMIKQFIVYQPKTPTLPTGAKAINVYNIMATFAANQVAGSDTISTGVLRKQGVREMILVNSGGGWSIRGAPAPTTDINGFLLFTNSVHTSNYFEYTFFGTGFDWRWFGSTAETTDARVTIDGVALNTTNFTISHNGGGAAGAGPAVSTTISSSAGTSFTPATGVIDTGPTVQTNGQSFTINGLTLGKHIVRVTNNANLEMSLDAFDVITPIHSHKSNLYVDLQNTLLVGSQGVEDLRKIEPLEQITEQKAWAQAGGVASSPTTTSAVAIPIPDLSVPIKTKGGAVEINYGCEFTISANATATFSIFVDGRLTIARSQTVPGAGQNYDLYDSIIVPLSEGVHYVSIYWQTNAGTLTAVGLNRILSVKEV